VVLLAGLTALVLLINPNSFRGEIARQVQQSSGYQVIIDGDLRWHVWPQLSILAGRVTVTAPMAAQPVATADNLRLDVKLWPLLSHQLVIDHILLKGAVIRLTPDSEAQQSASAPVSPASQSTNSNESQSLWNWNINTIEVSDGVLVWQKKQGEQLNIRELNLSFNRQEKNQANLQLSGTLNRDQKELKLSLQSEIVRDPQADNSSLNISELKYQLQGAGIPQQGIQGQGTLQLNYQGAKHLFTVNAMNFELNGAQLQGAATVKLGDAPEIALSLSSPEVKIGKVNDAATEQNQQDKTNSQPVDARRGDSLKTYDTAELTQALDSLKGFKANLQLKIADLAYQGTTVRQFVLDVENHQGQIKLNKLAGEVFGGQVEVNGTMQPAEQNYRMELQSHIQNLQLQPMQEAFNLPGTVVGRLFLQGSFQHYGVDFALKTWQGDINSTLNSVRLNGLNIQQIIQQSAERVSSNIRGRDRYERYTEVQEIVAEGKLLQGGLVQLRRLVANSPILQVAGAGDVNLLQQRCDLELKVRVKGDWRGKAELVKLLSDTAIPMRIYGPWKELQYRVEVDKLLQDQLKTRGKELLEGLLQRIR
ncbi:MAG: outer membrane assembly protein AsmA, partial [Enterobacteriaceae bacterium]